MRRLRMLPLLAAWLLLMGTPALASDLVLVGHPNSGLTTLERDRW